MDFDRLFQSMLRLDRRIVYSLIFIAVTFPFYIAWPPFNVEVSKEVRSTYDIIEAIPPNGQPLLISIDYDPASAAELSPMLVAALRHAFSRDIRVLVISLQTTGQGAGIATQIVPAVAAEYGKKQNVDWAFLGFQPNPIVAMMAMGEDMRRAFPRDYFDTRYEEIPLLAGVQNYSQIPAVLTLASTAVGESWAIYPGSRYGLTVLAGLTAVYVADIQPFYQSGQIRGIIGGLKGAAEYEKLLERPGDGTAGMRSQKVVHYTMIIFIVLGNIAYLWTRRRRIA